MLGVVDGWLIFFTLLISTAIGIYHAIKGRKNQSSEAMLMGNRKLKVFPVAVSMLVTYLSAVVIIGYPAEIYSNGVQIFFIQFLNVFICVPAASYIFVSVLYNLKLTSVFEYFELRFNSKTIRLICASVFILQFTIILSVTLYAPSLAFESLIGIPAWISVVTIGIIGTLYTAIGGIKAVIWTDVFQFVLIIIGMISIVIKGFLKAGGVSNAFSTAYENGRLNLFDWSIDPFQRYNTLNFLFGYTISTICFYGTNQANVQRYSSLPTFKDALKAMAYKAILKEITTILVICTGVSIFATYAGCDPVLLGKIKKTDQIVPYFFTQELSAIPGMMGIFISCILSAVLSTLSSGLNSISAVAWKDFFSHLKYFEKFDDLKKGKMTIFLVFIFGSLSIGLTFLVSKIGSIFQASVTIISAFSGTIGGCFIMGLFIPYVNEIGAIIGLLTSILITGLLTIKATILKAPYSTLPTYVDKCSNGTDFSKALNSTTKIWEAKQYEWPEKIYTISYILYPFISLVTIITVGVISTFISNLISTKNRQNVNKNYLHPLVHKFSHQPQITVEEETSDGQNKFKLYSFK